MLPRTLRYANWILNPFHRLDTAQLYALLSTSSFTERGLYLNLGYWRDADDIDAASEALAMLVAHAGGIGPGVEVLDCGFGFADQDMLWARRLAPARITGLNITPSQVTLARERVHEAGLDDVIDLREGSATEMPLPDASVDVVTALECAFHFRTRETFFGEAWRMLRPGGRLVTADIIPLVPAADRATRRRQRFSWWLASSKFVIPRENAWDIHEYGARLRGTGFEVSRLESIREDVYAPLHRFLASAPQRLERLHPVGRAVFRFVLARRPERIYAGLDYVLAVATKPG